MREEINHRNIPKYKCNEFPNNAGAKTALLFGDFSVVFVWIEFRERSANFSAKFTWSISDNKTQMDNFPEEGITF